MLFFDIIGRGSAIRTSSIAFALHDNSRTRVLMSRMQANLRAYIIHIIVRQKQGQDIQEVWLRTEDKISLIYKKRENYK